MTRSRLGKHLMVLVTTLSMVGIAYGQGTVSPDYFGMHINLLTTPWPTAPFSDLRLWNTSTTWNQINTGPGIYDFTMLDQWLSEAYLNNADVMYTFGFTPTWASSNPTGSCAANPPGTCYPPADLNSDGTGPDLYWQDFVTAIAMHSLHSPTAHIEHWEIWNEPTVPFQWQGTYAQLVRMEQDAYCIIKGLGAACTRPGIDPSATIHTPAPTGGVAAFFQNFLGAGGGQYADVVDYHTYVSKNQPGAAPPQPEDAQKIIKLCLSTLNTYGIATLPMWSTEGSWGNSNLNGFTDPDMQAAFAARYILIQWSAGLQRFYWHSWDSSLNGTLWQPTAVPPNCVTPNNGGYICEAGLGYTQMLNWMTGATFPKPCKTLSSTSTTWYCQITRSNNYVAMFVWDTSQSCSGGVCTTIPEIAPAEYINYQALDGTIHPIVNKTVPVGAKPILLLNSAATGLAENHVTP